MRAEDPEQISRRDCEQTRTLRRRPRPISDIEYGVKGGSGCHAERMWLASPPGFPGNISKIKIDKQNFVRSRRLDSWRRYADKRATNRKTSAIQQLRTEALIIVLRIPAVDLGQGNEAKPIRNTWKMERAFAYDLGAMGKLEEKGQERCR